MSNSREGDVPAGEDTTARYAASGLKHTLHGNIYQLKLLMLFMFRGLKNEYADFWLATEMDAAGKFDDVVFRYVDKQSSESKPKCHYLQAKHKQRRAVNHKIGPSQLEKQSKDGFSLPMYFKSYCKIIDHPDLTKSELQNVIIWTNADFAKDKELADQGIKLEKVEAEDKLLDTIRVFKQEVGAPKRCKLKIENKSTLYEVLRKSFEADILAEALVQGLSNEEPKLNLKTEIFKLYHVALKKEKIIDTGEKWLSEDFRKNRALSKRAQEFKVIFLEKLVDRNPSWIEAKPKDGAKFSETFGNEFKPPPNPKLSNVDLFTAAFSRLIRAHNNIEEVVKIDIKAYEIAVAGSDEKIIKADIKKLAGYVLTNAENGTFQFSTDFLKEGTKFKYKEFLTESKSLVKMREMMKQELQKDDRFQYSDLAKYRFEIVGDSDWDLMHAKTELPESKNADQKKTLIEDFLNTLIFAVNQLDEIELEKLITREIAEIRKINLLEAGLFSNALHVELLDWFKHKEGIYLTAKKCEDIMETIRERIETSHHLTSVENFQRFNAVFEVRDPQKLQTFLNDNKNFNVSNRSFTTIPCVGENILHTVIRVDQIIRDTEECEEKNIMICMLVSEDFSSLTRDIIARAFESSHSQPSILPVTNLNNNSKLKDSFEQFGETMKTDIMKKLIIINPFADLQLNQFVKYLQQDPHGASSNNQTGDEPTEVS